MSGGVEQPHARLLAIDDSELIHRLLRVRLRPEQIAVYSARTGAEGLQLADDIEPHVILLDIDLPDTDGYAILEELQTRPHLRDVPTIFVSATRETEVKVRCFDMGAHDFIMKPFDVAELRARVRAAIRMYRMIALLAQRAQVDGLTGVWNRAYFDQRLHEECSQVLRDDTELAVVIADLDHFKRTNDEHGHPFGDRVLQTFARILDDARESDVACRYGGEEFALIIPGADSEAAAEVAERIRRQVQATHWGAEYDDVRVTSSFGVAGIADASGSTPDALARSIVEVADQMLYAAKQGGRNCVMIAGQVDSGLKRSA